MNNMMQMIQSYNQFRQNMQGQNPDQIIQNLLQNGRISQAQYEQARQQAMQFQKMISPGAQG